MEVPHQAKKETERGEHEGAHVKRNNLQDKKHITTPLTNKQPLNLNFALPSETL